MLRYILCVMWMLGGVCTWRLAAQDIKPYNQALIWRGMEHQWTYNHRANRLGNYVSMSGGPKAIHSSATGLGSDSTFFTSYYSLVTSPDIYFKEVPVKIQLNGKEGALLTKLEEIYVSADPWMRDHDNYKAVINGFEMISLSKADQLQLFRFLVEDVVYSPASEELKVKAHFNLVTNCRTIECPVFSNKTAYSLTLHLLIIAYDDSDAHFVDAYTARNYVWDEQIEIDNLSQQVVVVGQSGDVYPQATLGITGLGIVLDEEHWLLEMDNYIIPNYYDAATGLFVSDANMKYVEWKKGMQQFAVSPFKAKFAKRRSGYALLDMNVSMIQFKNAFVKHGKSKGSSFWKGWNKDPSSTASETIVDLSDFVKESIK